MAHRIETALRQDLPDPAGRKVRNRIASDLGIDVDDVRVADGFIIDRELDSDQLRLIAEEVIQDPVIQDVSIDEPLEIPCKWLIEVGFRPGVTDNVGRTAREGIERTLACIVTGHDHGFSRNLVSEGPWGTTWSDEVYSDTFDEKA